MKLILSRVLLVLLVLFQGEHGYGFRVSGGIERIRLTSPARIASAFENSRSRRSSFLERQRPPVAGLQLKNFANGDNDDDGIPQVEFLEEADAFEGLVPRVYPERWTQLLYLSMLALLSDWICFSVAAAPSTYETLYDGHSAAALIDMFLFTNVASCFLVTDLVAKFGLGKSIKGAATLMAVGCLLRSGIQPIIYFLTHLGAAGAAAATSIGPHVTPYPLLVAGTVLVGATQPFFQCTPPMLSATWFASDERATSTAVALNFNQIGIATAFLVGGAMATSPTGLSDYFALITLVCAAVTAGTIFQFKDGPPSPPSSSEIEKLIKGEKEPPFLESVSRFIKQGPGFFRALAAFICSISITNVVGAFIDEVMERGGIHDQLAIDLAGAGFEIAILVGGIVIGGYVDRTKQYKTVTMACLAATVFLLLPLGVTEHAVGQEPLLLILSLLGLGMAVGPVQPINAELAVDVTYPSDETAVESVQQIGGNLVSALLVPLAERAADVDYQLFPRQGFLESDIRGDVILLMAVALVTSVFFSGFDSPLKRTIADCGDDGTCENPELNQRKLDIAMGIDGKQTETATALATQGDAEILVGEEEMSESTEEELRKLNM